MTDFILILLKAFFLTLVPCFLLLSRHIITSWLPNHKLLLYGCSDRPFFHALPHNWFIIGKLAEFDSLNLGLFHHWFPDNHGLIHPFCWLFSLYSLSQHWHFLLTDWSDADDSAFGIRTVMTGSEAESSFADGSVNGGGMRFGGDVLIDVSL